MKKPNIDVALAIAGLFISWAIWVTVAIFDTKTANAVTENKFDTIIKRLDEIKGKLESIR